METYVQARIQVEAFSRAGGRAVERLRRHPDADDSQTPRPVGWIFEEEDPWMQLIRAGMVVPFSVSEHHRPARRKRAYSLERIGASDRLADSGSARRRGHPP